MLHGNPIEAIATQMDSLKQSILEKYAGASKKTFNLFQGHIKQKVVFKRE